MLKLEVRCEDETSIQGVRPLADDNYGEFIAASETEETVFYKGGLRINRWGVISYKQLEAQDDERVAVSQYV